MVHVMALSRTGTVTISIAVLSFKKSSVGVGVYQVLVGTTMPPPEGVGQAGRARATSSE